MSRYRWWRVGIIIAGVAICAFWAYQLIAVRGTFELSRPAADAGGTSILTGPAGHSIAGRLYVAEAPSATAPLVVVLHGDAPFVNPAYQYIFAARLAEAVPGTRVAALLRPGYADPYGDKSDGDRGFALGQNYTHEVIDDLAAAIQALKSQWGDPAVILVGHSGGAALAADVAALHPGLVDHAFLVGCPCDVAPFRRHMARMQRDPLWLLPTNRASPMQTLDQMQKGTEITAISGSDDPIALPQYAESYVTKATRLGIAASLTILPGKGHEILDDPAVISEVANVVRSPKIVKQ
jgi:predicted esterase